MTVLVTKKRLEKTFKRIFDCHLNISIYLDIAKYSNIAKCIFKNVKLVENKGQKKWEKRSKKNLNSFSILIIDPN